MEVLEGNKLIAEFMGAKTQYDTDEEDEVFGLKLKGDIKLQYHTSWDWLMPVVEEIESIEIDTAPMPPSATPIPKKLFWVSIQKSNVTIAEDYKVTSIAERFNYKSKITAVWECVIQFITWYNSLNGGQNKKL